MAVVRSYGESTWTDNNGNENSKFDPLYIYFERKCFVKFDGDVSHGPPLSFDLSRIKIDSKYKAQLAEYEKQFLINVTFIAYRSLLALHFMTQFYSKLKRA